MVDRQPILDSRLHGIVTSRDKRGLLRRVDPIPNNKIDFSSNDYLGLARSKTLNAHFLHALTTHASETTTSPTPSPNPLLGSTGSRLLNGDSNLAHSLETFLSNFHSSQSALLFNSGYDANLSLFSTLPQPGDLVLIDELVHASVHDGVRILAVEACYSMDGDAAPLVEIVNCLEEFGGRAVLVVDEAHSTGVYGPQGKGLVASLNLESRIYARLVTFGKALGCHGAVILGSPTLRTYLINYARPLIYSTFISNHGLIAIKCAYQYLSQNAAQLQSHIHTNITHFRTTLTIPKPAYLLPSTSPIQGIVLPRNETVNRLAALLQDKGFDVRPIRSPTVPSGTERVRICLHVHNTREEIDHFARTCEWALGVVLGRGEGEGTTEVKTGQPALLTPKL
ncbi:hypothetical protein HK097_004690 [Rhizophlyctis rosea]|uniref:Aminotransferase class I/classII large domain-containing protein n=1 Tax=Rhizophlyctis rosea TaxID=64517 RepID=A0AAD5SFV9_9FUNG|nr:hypothetical protein HK097_004690 [Rhizophlyctis rosea]